MKKTFSLMVLTVGLLIGGIVATGEPPNFNEYNYRSPHPPPKASSAETAVDDVINIILAQGFSGAIILILFFWTYRTDKYNRTAQEENFNKFIQISQECSSNMGSVNTRLENIEREIEQSKQLEMLNASRKG